MTKKLISTLLVLITVFALCSCGIITAEPKTEKSTTKATSVIKTSAEVTTGTEKASTQSFTEATTEKSTTATSTSAVTSKKPISTEKTTYAVSTTSAVNTTSTTKSTTQQLPQEQSFLNNSVFVGDSVSLKLKLYASNRRNSGYSCMGNAKFLCSGSLGYNNALWTLNASGNVHPSYNGVKYRVPEGVAATGASKVFIMLGMNDFMLYGFDGAVSAAQKLIKEIISVSPSVKIYVQSVTPILSTKQVGSKTNANVDYLNTKLKSMCELNGWSYIDIAPIFKDANNCLRAEYCSDPASDGMGIHFTDAACRKWIEYLERLAL